MVSSTVPKPGGEMPASRADALDQELPQLVRQAGSFAAGKLPQVRRLVGWIPAADRCWVAALI